MTPSVDEWLDGLRSLDPRRTQVPGLLNATWPKVYDNALDFVRDWGDAAIEAGWTTVQLFGVHPEAGVMRADCTGTLIVYRPVTVVSLTAKLIVLSNGLRSRGKHNVPESVPIWRYRPPSRGA